MDKKIMQRGRKVNSPLDYWTSKQVIIEERTILASTDHSNSESKPSQAQKKIIKAKYDQPSKISEIENKTKVVEHDKFNGIVEKDYKEGLWSSLVDQHIKKFNNPKLYDGVKPKNQKENLSLSKSEYNPFVFKDFSTRNELRMSPIKSIDMEHIENKYNSKLIPYDEERNHDYNMKKSIELHENDISEDTIQIRIPKSQIDGILTIEIERGTKPEKITNFQIRSWLNQSNRPAEVIQPKENVSVEFKNVTMESNGIHPIKNTTHLAVPSVDNDSLSREKKDILPDGIKNKDYQRDDAEKNMKARKEVRFNEDIKGNNESKTQMQLHSRTSSEIAIINELKIYEVENSKSANKESNQRKMDKQVQNSFTKSKITMQKEATTPKSKVKKNASIIAISSAASSQQENKYKPADKEPKKYSSKPLSNKSRRDTSSLHDDLDKNENASNIKLGTPERSVLVDKPRQNSDVAGGKRLITNDRNNKTMDSVSKEYYSSNIQNTSLDKNPTGWTSVNDVQFQTHDYLHKHREQDIASNTDIIRPHGRKTNEFGMYSVITTKTSHRPALPPSYFSDISFENDKSNGIEMSEHETRDGPLSQNVYLNAKGIKPEQDLSVPVPDY